MDSTKTMEIINDAKLMERIISGEKPSYFLNEIANGNLEIILWHLSLDSNTTSNYVFAPARVKVSKTTLTRTDYWAGYHALYVTLGYDNIRLPNAMYKIAHRDEYDSGLPMITKEGKRPKNIREPLKFSERYKPVNMNKTLVKHNQEWPSLSDGNPYVINCLESVLALHGKDELYSFITLTGLKWCMYYYVSEISARTSVSIALYDCLEPYRSGLRDELIRLSIISFPTVVTEFFQDKITDGDLAMVLLPVREGGEVARFHFGAQFWSHSLAPLIAKHQAEKEEDEFEKRVQEEVNRRINQKNLVV